MMMIISPAKIQSDISNTIQGSKTSFGSKTSELVKVLKKLKSEDIENLMGVSPAIGLLNYNRFQNFEKQARIPAAYMFKGETYVGLGFDSLKNRDQDYAQQKLQILSGLYGMVSPMDLIAPYRLEMGTSISPKEGIKNLYQFWQKTITKKLKEEIGEKEYLINLASIEYAKALDLSEFKVMTPVFKKKSNGVLKTAGMMSKRARGMMARYIIENQITDIKRLKDFPHYKYSAKLSTDDEWVFMQKG